MVTTVTTNGGEGAEAPSAASRADIAGMTDDQLNEFMANPANLEPPVEPVVEETPESIAAKAAADALELEAKEKGEKKGAPEPKELSAEDTAILEALDPAVVDDLVALQDLSVEDVEALAALSEEEIEALAEMQEDLEDDELDPDGKKDDGAIDYKAIYEQIFANPIQANGRPVQIESAEEAIALIQQGLGFHKNMAKIKPHKQVISLIEKRGGLSAEDLNFLMDVKEGKPEAVAKILKDHKIDPMEVDTEVEYESTFEDTSAGDELTAVLDSLPSGEHKITTLQILSPTGWDATSKKALYSKPEDIRVINEHVTNGTYQVVMAEIDKQRALGNYLDLSDIDAYNTVGNVLAKKGVFGVSKPPASKQSAHSNASRTEQKKKAAPAPRSKSSNAETPLPFNAATATEEELDAYIAKYKEDEAKK